MMKIQIDEKGYVQNFVLVGEGSACNINVAEPDNFSSNLQYYRAWKYDGEKIVFDSVRAYELENDFKKNDVREDRARKCFSVINRGELWYARLTEEQKAELEIWYQEWLDAPQTGVEPDDLPFI